MYSEVNRVVRDKDLTYLKELGPFVKVLSEITLNSENHKKANDIVNTGKNIGGVINNMAGSFLLFRGAPMLPEWVKPYELYTEHLMTKLPSYNSCSKSLIVALQFAFPKILKPNLIPTLFVIAC